MATQVPSVTVSSGSGLLLRRALLADGVVSAVTGAALVTGAHPIAGLLGLEAPVNLAVLGDVAMVYGLGLLIAIRAGLTTQAGKAALILNAVWIIASVIIVAGGWPPLSTTGKWLVLAAADAVAGLTAFELAGLRRLRP